MSRYRFADAYKRGFRQHARRLINGGMEEMRLNANIIMNFISSGYVRCWIMLRVELGIVTES